MDALAAGRVIEPLRAAGVRLVTCGEGAIDWETFEGRIVYMVSQEGKHAQQRDTSRNTLRGKLAAIKTQYSNGMPAYAYDRVYYDETGEFVKRVPWNQNFRRADKWTCRLGPSADVTAVEVVRGIFRAFVEGDATLSAIARDLNSRKIPTRFGALWQTTDTPQNTDESRVHRPRCVWQDGPRQVSPRGRWRRNLPGCVVPQQATRLSHQAGDRPQERARRDYRRADVSRRATETRRAARAPTQGRGIRHICYPGLCGAGTVANRWPASLTASARDTTAATVTTARARSVRCDLTRSRRFVITTIQAKLLSPSAIKSLRAELTKQIERKSRKPPAVETKRLKSAIDKLDAKIDRGAENLLLADPDNFAAMQTTLNGWRRETRRTLPATRRGHSKAGKRRPRTDRRRDRQTLPLASTHL